MDPVAPHLDLTLQLPRDMYYQLVHTLRGSFPPPVTDAPEDHGKHPAGTALSA